MKLLDLTIKITEALPTFPGSPHLHILPWNTLRGDGFNLEMLFMSSHSGTHMDAPYHFVEDGLKIHQIPLDRLTGTAFLLHTPKDPRQAITIQDIQEFEKQYETIHEHSTIVFHTGWENHLGKNDYFTHNPGLSAEAAEYLADKRINLLGTDSPSIDVGGKLDFPAHKILAQAGTINVESLVHLELIKSHIFTYIIMPMKLNATGSPVRAVAVINE